MSATVTRSVARASRSWLDNKLIYVVAAPALTLLGAGTTILAPMLLTPANFTEFALLNSLFVYLAEFDFGLARLADRMLPRCSPREAAPIMGTLLRARYLVAIGLLAVMAPVSLLDPLMFVAAIAGVAVLLANGPLSFHRARSNTAAFTGSSLLMQLGMTLPRLGGLLLYGVRGCMIALALWEAMCCVVLNRKLFRLTRRGRLAAVPALLTQAVPLFIYQAAWLLYLFANRWLSLGISGVEQAGLFAFGANLTAVCVFMVGTLAQPYYPAHLANPNPRRLNHELWVLLGLGLGGCGLGEAFCRWGLVYVFPHFSGAAPSTGALLLSGLPLGLSGWLIPLAIAHAARARAREVALIPLCVALMAGLMWLGGEGFSVVGQAWACVPPALLMLAGQLRWVVRAAMLKPAQARRIWLACAGAVAAGIALWILLFEEYLC